MVLSCVGLHKEVRQTQPKTDCDYSVEENVGITETSPRKLEQTAKMRNAYKILARKPEGKIPRERPRRRREDKVKVELEQMTLQVWTDFGCRSVADS